MGVMDNIYIKMQYMICSYIISPSKWNICQKKWLKNYGEKWSRKIYFEIPPCGKLVNFVTELVILGKNLPFYEVK